MESFVPRNLIDSAAAPTLAEPLAARRLLTDTLEGRRSKLEGKTAVLPEEGRMLLAGAVLGSAAIFIASKGRARGLLVNAPESSGLAAGVGRLFAQGGRQEGKGILLNMQEFAGDLQNAGRQAAAEIKTAMPEPSALPPLTFTRSAEEEAKHAAADLARQKANALQELDQAVRDEARSVERQLRDSGKLLKHPVTGAELNGNEHLYNTYVDALPRKTALQFGENGDLLPGIYRLNFADFKAQFAYNARRQELLNNFEPVLQTLSQSGVKEVHVGGSFVTAKSRPGDIDFLWNKHEGFYDRAFLANNDHGLLLEHNSPWLRQKGLQMMTDPPPGGTYKGMQYFFAHGRAEWEGKIRGAWRKTGTDIPKGLVELDLTSMPRQWLKEVAKQAA